MKKRIVADAECGNQCKGKPRKKLATMKLIYSDRKLENEKGAESNWSA